MARTELMESMWVLFKELGAKAITYNHYELAEKTVYYTPDDWKAFLNDAEVSEWIKHEVKLLNNSEVIKMVYGASSTKSVGQAQLINSLSKLQEDDIQKDLPIFVYSYIPLDKNEIHSPVVAPQKGNINGA